MIGDVLETLFAGRTTIGIVDSEKNEVDLNVTTSHSQTYNVDHPEYPIEVDPDNSTPGTIRDHVVHKDSSIDITAIISDTVDDLTGKIITKTAVEKLKQLVRWQRTGAIVSILGYGTGGLADTATDFLKSSLSSLFGGGVEESFYMGTDREEVKNMLIGNITMKRSRDNGVNIECTIQIKRAQLATRRSLAIGVSTGNIPQQTGSTSVAPNQTLPG